MQGTSAKRRYVADVPLQAAIGRLTHGISPAAMTAALQDWITHLAASPGKRFELFASAHRKALRALLWLDEAGKGRRDSVLSFIAEDRRFDGPDWRHSDAVFAAGAFLLAQQWWEAAARGVPGVSAHHEEVTSFMARQWLDMMSPSNVPWLNPEVASAAARSAGMTLWRGLCDWANDATRVAGGRPPRGVEAFRPGERVATTPGKVVHRNALIELIQYSPATKTVRPEPLLIVPSWIMKYYILDLSPGNSLVRHLVAQGFTVFMVSWRNPGAADADVGMEDYLEHGVFDALRAVQRAQPGRGIHLAGYCLGGTLAAIAAAWLARAAEAPLKSFTLLAAQTDFEEPGELGLFIDESQISFLEGVMSDQGYLDGRQMAGAFALINSKDLVWSKLVHEYLMGGNTPLDDLHAWNADATRLPARMHSEYLRQLYLDNDLAEGRYRVRGSPVLLENLRVPMFVLATERDHVSPWRSVYKVLHLTHTEVTFVLTSGGHNVGVVNPPRAPEEKVFHRIGFQAAETARIDASSFVDRCERRDGTWWPTWWRWLADRSGEPVTPSPVGGDGPEHLLVLDDAPGRLVHES